MDGRAVGLARTDGVVSDAAELLRSADRATLDAKAEGKNRMVGTAEPPVASNSRARVSCSAGDSWSGPMSRSTKNRYARSVGTRPADVCGWRR